VNFFAIFRIALPTVRGIDQRSCHYR